MLEILQRCSRLDFLVTPCLGNAKKVFGVKRFCAILFKHCTESSGKRMIEFTIPALTALLLYLQKERHQRTKKNALQRERTGKALLAAYVAADQTQIYLQEYRNRGRRSRRAEEKLAALWVRAGVAFRHVNRDLAERCFLKRQLWSRPEIWKREHVRALGLELTQVREDIQKLLYK